MNKAKTAQSSYQHAIELAPGHSVIWTEYGNFVYMVHSFCSRLLKQETDTLSMERFEILETRKEEMLEIADQCFESANRICQTIEEPTIQHDERWLYQYMLGKVAEKKNQDPPVFLEHYAKVDYLSIYFFFFYGYMCALDANYLILLSFNFRLVNCYTRITLNIHVG